MLLHNVSHSGYRSGAESSSPWWSRLSKRSCSWLIYEKLALNTQSGHQQNEQNTHTPGTWASWRGRSHQWWVTFRLYQFILIHFYFILMVKFGKQSRPRLCVQNVNMIFKYNLNTLIGYLQLASFLFLGMRQNCDLAVYIDVAKAMSGIKKTFLKPI